MIKIQNIYYMLAYAFKALKKQSYSKFSEEKFDNALDLFAAILAKGIINQVKRGLGKEYLYRMDMLAAPRGKIDIMESVKRKTVIKNNLICCYDELSDNITINQILKSTAEFLVKSNQISNCRKRELQKALIYLGSVDCINLESVNWHRIQYNKNNETYRMLINICFLATRGMIFSEKEGNLKLRKFYDDQKMHKLYEHFVLEYYKKHYPQLKPVASQIKWNTDDEMVKFLPVMRTDITLQYKEKVLIIDTKYYRKSMQNRGNYGSYTVNSENIYQIYAYVKNKDNNNSGNVSGMLLYAKTDQSKNPDFEYHMSGNTIWVKTLDLNQEFMQICQQLDKNITDWLPDEKVIRYT